jgi:phosphoserine phosphatase RsbU/P
MTEASELLVGDIMVQNPVTVVPDTTVADVARLMGQQNIGAVLVVVDGAVQGVFSERDLLRRAADARQDWDRSPISRFMTPNPVTVSPDVPWADAMAVMDARRIRHLPVVQSDRLVGMLSVRDLLHHRAEYLEALVHDRTAELAARNAALTARDQQITRHLKVAAKIQKRLLPEKLPQFDPFRFAAAFRGHDQVTGDYHDFLPIGPDRLGILIADASGHGIPAAFVSVMAKMCCNAYCQNLESPAAILSTMNDHLGDLIEAEHFITMFAAILHRRSMQLSFARAGHPLPLLYRATTRVVTPLDGPGAMIGVMPDPPFSDEYVTLESSDKVLLFTDGVPECRNPDERELGTERLRSFLEREGHRPAEELLLTLEAELDRYRGDRPFDDDVTIIIIEAPEETSRSASWRTEYPNASTRVRRQREARPPTFFFSCGSACNSTGVEGRGNRLYDRA